MNEETKAAARVRCWPLAEWQTIMVRCEDGNGTTRFIAKRITHSYLSNIFACRRGDRRTYFQAVEPEPGVVPIVRDVTILIAMAEIGRFTPAEAEHLFQAWPTGGAVLKIEDLQGVLMNER